MEMKQLAKHLIYDCANKETPDNYARFGIMSPEYASHGVEVKPYPLPESEHLFALFWDIHDSNKLSATILPSSVPFTYNKEFQPGTRTQMHSHEYLELFYIIDGEYRQKILGNEFTFHKGELCLIDKNCQHQEILDGTSATILFLGITNVMFNDIMNRQITTERIASFLNMALLEQKTLQQYLYFRPQEGAASLVEDALIALVQELEHHDVATPFITQGFLLRIFWVLSTQYEFSLSKKLRKKMKWILFEEVTDYMKKNLDKMSIRCLTEEFHFQEDYFNRLLKVQTGMTYTEYLQFLRLQMAENLLKDTDYSIDRIAKEVGYHNKGYFYKIFTERNQLTPAQFRKKLLD
ncbi:two-component response regulator yesN [Lachnospiraceae bacterium KM106-2]|nr:two-component response regulator yesN [Lachnospiraceae bacterium KM106-2]